jgi:L-iditol 2-dehydrogenase
MKAAVLKSIGQIEIQDVENPKCTSQSVVIKVESSALCGSDIRAIRAGRTQLHLPQILGHEVVGTVIEIGDDVHGIKKGDRVTVVPSIPCTQCRICRRGLSPDLCPDHISIGFAYPGGFSEYMLIPPEATRAHALLQLPEALDFDTAVLAEPLGCVLHGQDQVHVLKGDRVVVIGAGPIGCMHAMVAKHMGAKQVILLQRSPKRLQEAKSLNVADAYISVLDPDVIDNVREITSGEFADVVIVAASSKEAQLMAFDIVGIAGRINFFGGLRVPEPFINIPSNRVHYEELVITGSAGTGAKEMKRALDVLVKNQDQMNSLVTRKYSLDKINEAIKAAENGNELKILVKAFGGLE